MRPKNDITIILSYIVVILQDNFDNDVTKKTVMSQHFLLVLRFPMQPCIDAKKLSRDASSIVGGFRPFFFEGEQGGVEGEQGEVRCMRGSKGEQGA